ncbi:MAG: hypothetical protein H0T17_06805 [Propionibacteriales bacterium]|nr:hypothetical protein [Propionibacteriales bacterium]
MRSIGALLSLLFFHGAVGPNLLHLNSSEGDEMNRLMRWLLTPRRDERGDVPGWVMITVMTIVIASAILAIFQDRVTTFLGDTLDTYM